MIGYENEPLNHLLNNYTGEKELIEKPGYGACYTEIAQWCLDTSDDMLEAWFKFLNEMRPDFTEVEIVYMWEESKQYLK